MFFRGEETAVFAERISLCALFAMLISRIRDLVSGSGFMDFGQFPAIALDLDFLFAKFVELLHFAGVHVFFAEGENILGSGAARHAIEKGGAVDIWHDLSLPFWNEGYALG